jgi:catechol 2,3-dioxygenase-like lactoylglutathione lyase family enzyme
MRLDHIAYRVPNRDETVEHLTKMFGYYVAEEFTIDFDDGSKAECKAMVPPENEKTSSLLGFIHFCQESVPVDGNEWNKEYQSYHLVPEIFVSEGTPGSIVEKWIKNTPKGQGGIHHLAYSTDRIDDDVKEWKDKGVEFLTEDVIDCPDDDLRQIFTKPQPLLGGVIIELIERGDKGFCKNSVKQLMEATDENRDK